jgi:hypothetical protein
MSPSRIDTPATFSRRPVIDDLADIPSCPMRAAASEEGNCKRPKNKHWGIGAPAFPKNPDPCVTNLFSEDVLTAISSRIASSTRPEIQLIAGQATYHCRAKKGHVPKLLCANPYPHDMRDRERDT